MSEQQQAPARTTVSLYEPVYQRLAALRRKIGAGEGRDLTLGETIEWLLDRADRLAAP